MLAYVFWHRPHAGATGYEAALLDLHAQLAATSPPGFQASASFARAELPWFDGYEDWYLVDDWAALGVLNEAAYRLKAHDPLADRSEDGAGAVFSLRSGTLDLHQVTTATYSSEPVTGDVTWRRQMVLGPAPQYIAHSAEVGGERGAGAFQRGVELVVQR